MGSDDSHPGTVSGSDPSPGVDPQPPPPTGPPPAGFGGPFDAPTDPLLRPVHLDPAAAPRNGAVVQPPRTHRWGLGAYLLVELVFLLASAAVGLLVVGREPAQAGGLAVALTVPTLLAAGLALLITKVRGNGPRIDLRLRWSAHELRMGLAFGAGGLFVTLPASMIYIMIVGKDATSTVGEVFGGVRASVPLAAFIFLAVVVVAPLCEEIVYRGLLWGAVERLGAARWVAMAVTTLLFALAHFEFTRTPLLLIVAVPIALARFYTDGLLASIVAHQVNNLLPGIALALGLVGAIPMV